MIKEYYSITEAAKILGISRQALSQQLQRSKIVLEYEKDKNAGSIGIKCKLPISFLFYGTHQNLTIWGTPYKDGDQWKIKSRTKDGEQTHKIQEGE